MIELLIWLRVLAALLTITWQLPRILKQINQSDKYWELRNTLAEVRMKARGHLSPVIIERLDDGTNLGQQHLRIDMARHFPQERLEGALYSWSSQSFSNVVLVVFYVATKQAAQTAQPGEERTTEVTLDVLSSGIRAIFTLHLQDDGDWQMVSPKPKIKVNLRQHFAAIKAKSDLEERLREEAKAEHRGQVE